MMAGVVPPRSDPSGEPAVEVPGEAPGEDPGEAPGEDPGTAGPGRVALTRTCSPGQASQGALVVLDARTHGDREFQVGDRAGPLARPLTGQGEPEVRVVVHRVDRDSLGELPACPRRLAAHEQGPPERLPDRALLRLHQPGAGEQHRRLVRVAV